MRLLFILLAMCAASVAQVRMTPERDRVRIDIDGKHYTDFIIKDPDAMKPYLWPLRAPSGVAVTRHFPMETVGRDPKDHPHQRGLWFGPEDVNGVNFWANETSYKSPPPLGRIVYDSIKGGKTGSFTTTLKWVDPS